MAIRRVIGRAWLAGVLAAGASLAGLTTGAGAATFTGGPVTIADSFSPPTLASPYPSTIVVTGEDYITSLRVRLANFSHDFPEDADIVLVGPQGPSVMLMSDAGTDPATNVDLVFSDAGLTPVPSTTLASGTYTPTNYDGGDSDSFPAPAPALTPAGALSAFNETEASGTWSLYVVDDSEFDAGSIAAWSLTIQDRSRRSVHLSVGGSTPESAGAMVVNVTRDPGGHAGSFRWATGGAAPAYYSGGPLATPGEDYTPASGTVQFAEGQTAASFAIPLVNDSLVENTEQIPVQVSDPTGDVRLPVTTTYLFGITSEDQPVAPPPPAKPTLGGPTTQRILKQRGRLFIWAKAQVSGQISAYWARVSMPRPSRPVMFAPARVPVAAGHKAKLTLTLSRKSLKRVARALATHKRLRARVIMRLQDSSGRSSPAVSRTIMLRR